jgi:catalase
MRLAHTRNMPGTKIDPASSVAEEALQSFDALNGPQPGFRPAHAKGILLTGTFTPSPDALSLTSAPHIQRASTPVTVRFSDFAGVPKIPDNDPNASPRGLAIRFHLAEHVHTDIISHSVDGFPARTAEEFVEFLRAIYDSMRTTLKPTPIEKFLGAHPAALEFVQAPKPMPASFASESYFAVSAYKFIDRSGAVKYGRYRIHPEGANHYLDHAVETRVPPNFLFDEIAARLAKGPVKMRIAVQIADAGDVTNDATVHWPKERPEIAFGTVEIAGIAPNNEAEQRQIIFDPVPRVDGIESSDDPLTSVRATTYLLSGRRRRAQGGTRPK